MSSKMAFHVADLMTSPGAAVVAPDAGVYVPSESKGMVASYLALPPVHIKRHLRLLRK